MTGSDAARPAVVLDLDDLPENLPDEVRERAITQIKADTRRLFSKAWDSLSPVPPVDQLVPRIARRDLLPDDPIGLPENDFIGAVTRKEAQRGAS